MSAALKLVKPQTAAEKVTLTTTDVLEVTPALVKSWKSPPFQRPLKENAKVLAVAKEIAETQVIPGYLTIGVLNGERYLIDGQHRRHAFILSDVPVAYVDIRVVHYKTMADMAEEFFELNSRLAVMKPDDYLRALESSEPTLVKIRKRCSLVTYGQVRRGEKAPVISMSNLLRMWWASSKETPAQSVSAIDAVRAMTDDDTAQLGDFLDLASAAWGSDTVYHRLWNSLNLVMCMWLYRRTVIQAHSPRGARPTPDQFKKCLVALTANDDYLEWLRNRSLSDQNRSPAYRRVKETFAKRLQEETGAKVVLPAPEWAPK